MMGGSFGIAVVLAALAVLGSGRTEECSGRKDGSTSEEVVSSII